MRKLLVLMLVLCLASAANATLTLSVDGLDAGDEITIIPSDDIVVGIYSDNSNSYSAYFEMWDGPGTFSNPRYTQGGFPPIIPYPSYYGYPYDYYLVTVADSGGGLVPGVGFEVDFHCDGPGDVLVQLYDATGYNVIDTLVIHQPEPMTIVLLGLGGLLLRRRK